MMCETIMPQNYSAHFPNRTKLSFPLVFVRYLKSMLKSVRHIVDTSPSKIASLGVAFFGIE